MRLMDSFEGGLRGILNRTVLNWGLGGLKSVPELTIFPNVKFASSISWEGLRVGYPMSNQLRTFCSKASRRICNALSHAGR